MDKTKLFNRILMIAFVIILLSVSIVYAASSGEMGFTGIAYLQEYDSDNQFLFFPIPDDNGYFFTSSNMPAGLEIGEQGWVENIFSLVIIKTNQGNSGNNTMTMNFNFENLTSAAWTNGIVTVDHIYTDDEKNGMFKTLPNFTAFDVPSLSKGWVTMDFSGKIFDTVTDAIQFDVTYTYQLADGSDAAGIIYFRLEFRGIGVSDPYDGWPPI